MSSKVSQELVETLLSLSENLVTHEAFPVKMELLCERTKTLMDCDRCSIFIKSGQACWGKFNAGNPADIDVAFRKHRVPLTDPMVQEAFTFNRPVLVNDVNHDQRLRKGMAKSANINAIVIAPLLEHDEPIGFITAEYNQRSGKFTGLDANFLEGIAKIASSMIVIDNGESERTNLDDRIKELQRFEPLGRLAGGLAHDFNNTLTIVMGYCELIQMGASKNETARYLEAIKSATLKASNLSKQLLTYSKGGTTNATSVDLCSILSELAPLLKTLFPDSITLENHIATPSAWVFGDRSDLDQVTMNLILNARDSIDGVGRVTINLDKADDKVILTISDTGCGIDSKDLDRIFDPFFSTKNERGLGLGLANVREIVNQCIGKISVESSTQGTAFRISFPEHEPSQITKENAKNKFSKLTDGVTILIVDDQTSLLEVQTLWLKREGYEVLSTPNPLVAQQWLQDKGGEIDLLITDMLMPNISGSELVNTAALLGVKRALVVSGYQGSEELNLDRTDIKLSFLAKPFRPSQLQTAIEKIFSAYGEI